MREEQRRPRGRPRSEPKRQAILAATIALIDSRGFTGLSVDAIAEQAGVGKATIYRWWPNKAAVMVDAALSMAAPAIPHPRTGSAREDLVRHLRYMIRIFRGARTGAMISAILAEAQHDPELAAEVDERVQAPRRAAAKRILEDGIARGQLRADLDCDEILDMIYGPIYYRLLVTHKPMASGYAEAILDHIWPAISAPPARPTRRPPAAHARTAARPAGSPRSPTPARPFDSCQLPRSSTSI